MEIPCQPSKSLRALNPHLYPEPSARRGPELEKVLHAQIERYCRARGWLVLHSRMDMPSTIPVGFPDFTIFMPGRRVVFLECKRPGGKATTEQLAAIAKAKLFGFVAEIVDSLDAALAAIETA